jgi:hypothetical protein
MTRQSKQLSDDRIRQIDPSFLLVFNARRPRISHRYRDIAVQGGPEAVSTIRVTSRTGSDDAIR